MTMRIARNRMGRSAKLTLAAAVAEVKAAFKGPVTTGADLQCTQVR